MDLKLFTQLRFILPGSDRKALTAGKLASLDLEEGYQRLETKLYTSCKLASLIMGECYQPIPSYQ